MPVIQAKCSCGQPVEIRTGRDADSRYRCDGKQAVYPGEKGYSIFRCCSCLECLDETVAEFAYETP